MRKSNTYIKSDYPGCGKTYVAEQYVKNKDYETLLFFFFFVEIPLLHYETLLHTIYYILTLQLVLYIDGLHQQTYVHEERDG